MPLHSPEDILRERIEGRPAEITVLSPFRNTLTLRMISDHQSLADAPELSFLTTQERMEQPVHPSLERKGRG